MSAIDYQPSHHAVSYGRTSTIEHVAAEQLAQANPSTGRVDLTHNVAMDELPD